MRNSVGLPFETTMAGAALVFGGVIERYPDINFCLCHGGGFLPYQAGRFMHAFSVRDEAKARLQGSPQDSLSRLHYDTILHSPRALEFLIAAVGPGRVLMGSDYPFDMGELGCVARVEGLGISRASRDAILGGRAENVGLIFDLSGGGCGERSRRSRPPTRSIACGFANWAFRRTMSARSTISRRCR
jgi:aminocarboxymuconate-semialdehyde decarboxylase